MPADSPPGSRTITLHGGRQAIVARPDKGWPQCVQLEITGGGQQTFREAKWSVGASTARRKLAREANLTDAEVQQIEDGAILFQAEVTSAEHLARMPVMGCKPFEVLAHSQITGKENLIPVESAQAFLDLLRQPQGDSVFLRWTTNDIAVCDVDFHQGTAPTPIQMRRLMDEIAPTGLCMHTTSRGFHVLYATIDGYQANELAALAASALLIHPLVVQYKGSVEILRRTRHPRSAHNGKVYGQLQILVPDTVTPLLDVLDEGGVDGPEREQALEHYGWSIGERLAHDNCPIDPGHASKSPAPVLITEHGVFCYSCAARGDGFRSWNTLRAAAGMPVRVSGDTKILREAIRAYTPHAHVARMLEALLPEMPRMHLNALHRVLLKREHGAVDPLLAARLPTVFRDFPFVRGASGRWLHSETLQPVLPRLGRSEVQTCSYVQAPVQTEMGLELKPDACLVTVLATDGPVRGFYPITSTARSPIWHVHNRPRRNGSLCAQPRDPQRSVLKYRSVHQRISREDCQRIINTRFPSLDFNYLTLLHVSRGLGEQGTCQLPILWATGPTSSGKTSHVAVECAMHDETPENLTIDDKTGRPTDMLGEMQGRTGFSMLDDFGKNLEGRGGQERTDNLIAFILQYGRSITYHHRHVGMLNVRVTTPLVLTDVRQPQKLVQSEQVGRRIILVPLQHKVDWNGTHGQRNGFLDWWRETEELTAAAESWHSYIVDDYFPEGATTSIFEHAKRLGYNSLATHFEDQETAQSKRELIRQFVQALLLAPPASPSMQHAQGRGVAEILPTAITDPLTVSATTLCEMLGSETVEAWALKQALEPYQASLHTFLPFNEAVHIDIRKHGRHILARVVQAARQASTQNGALPLRINADLLAAGATPKNMLDAAWTQAA